jgi:rfaE bifunctional protein kinase chain/domain
MTNLDKDIRRHFRGKKIAVIGDIVADQFLSGTISRVSREAPVFILKHNDTETRPGAAANAAANVAALGGVPILIGVVGNDQTAESLFAALASSNVDTKNIIRDEVRRTTLKVRVLAGQTYAARQQVIRIDYENESEMPNDAGARILGSALAAIADADAVVVSDYGYGIAATSLIDQVKQAAKARSIPIVADSRNGLKNFSGFTSATPNKEEAEALLNDAFEMEHAEKLREQLDLDSIVVTLGGRGMAIAEKGKPVSAIPAVGSDQPVDVTGAGDTVIAAFALGLASGMTAVESASVANHAGGIVVMKRGTAVAAIEELERSLTADQHPETHAAANE